ncbi:CTLH/CRA C-terminal to lish motif domain-containing protein [Sporodiniella umbellata]|nr:CTLH/CRA C-terminal to lish motif domain-containing protein [Sporodiniella umbellata]
MSSSTGQNDKKKTIAKSEWEQRLAEVQVHKQDLNQLIMNYLVIEGYRDATEQFSEESGLEPTSNLDSIQERMNIRQAIQSGGIDTAIDLVNELNPEILDANPQLYFHLQQQQLIELIRQGDVQEALEFATEELAPRGAENPEFLNELEKTMALLAFHEVKDSPVQELLFQSQRQKTAVELNTAILASQSQESESKLPHLLKMLAWSQEQLNEKVNFPQVEDWLKADLVVKEEDIALSSL